MGEVDPIALQIYIILGEIDGRLIHTAVVQDRSAAPLVLADASDEHFADPKAFAFRKDQM